MFCMTSGCPSFRLHSSGSLITDYDRTWKLRNRILATEVGPYILQSSGREAAAIYQSDSKDGARPQELTNHKDQAVYNDNYC